MTQITENSTSLSEELLQSIPINRFTVRTVLFSVCGIAGNLTTIIVI